jgi:Tol biopolymer transport system component
LGTLLQHQRINLSADGKQLLVARAEAGSHRSDYWVWDMERKIWTRMISHSSPGGGSAIWSPDKRRIAFACRKSGTINLYLKDADGSAQEEPLLDSANWMFPLDWSPDGQFLLCQGAGTAEEGVAEELWVVSLTGKRKTLKIASSVNGEARFAPDGRSIVYGSDKSGRSEIYLQSFPGDSSACKSQPGGSTPRWGRNGKEIFFVSADEKLMAARLGPNMHTGTPEPLFDLKSKAASTEFEVAQTVFPSAYTREERRVLSAARDDKLDGRPEALSDIALVPAGCLLNAAPSGIDIRLVRSQHYANLSQDFFPLERRRPPHPRPEGSQSGVREAAVSPYIDLPDRTP